MIPGNITAHHVHSAIERIRREGYSARRESSRFDLAYEGERFPPKVVISYANKFANGEDLAETTFSGGEEANKFLTNLGFEILEKTGTRSVQTWIFQSNPDTYDIDGYLEEETDITWTARQRAADIRIGDHVFIWRAAGTGGAQAGVIARAVVTELARVRPEDAVALPYWRSGTPQDERRVRLEVDRVANKRQVIKREWLADDPALSELRILKMRNSTNYLLPEDQAERLDHLWRNTGRDWDRAESVAGLWAYAETYGGPVSKQPGSAAADVALRIGRAVTGVYNKVMNFRAIDPRDERAGLMGASDSDYKVWDEFFDADARVLKQAALESEFQRLWPADEESTAPAEPESHSVIVDDEEPDPTSGQGYVLDKWRRKAVELNAMEAARDHYEAQGYAVRDTSANKPYDFRCVRHGDEVRVEVKGTTTAGTRILLTAGEINNARGEGWRTDLFVLSGIEVRGNGREAVATGGKTRVIESWRPSDEDLRALSFSYRVPETSN